jgi:hypothetical protein
MPGVRVCWHEARWAVTGCDDDEDVICEDKVVEVLNEDELFASDGWGLESERPSTVEAKVEGADIRGYTDYCGQSGQDAFLVGGVVVEGNVYVVERAFGGGSGRCPACAVEVTKDNAGGY